MNTGYHDRSKKARIYGSIIIYKIISLVILIALTIIMTFTFFIEKNKVTDANNRPVSVIFYIMGFCIFLFALSIILDFYIRVLSLIHI